MLEKRGGIVVSYQALQNVRYLVRRAYELDKWLFVQFFGYTVLSATSPFVSILGLKLLIDELSGEGELLTLGVIVMGMFLLQVVLDGGMQVLKSKYEPRLVAFRFRCMGDLQETSLQMKFEETENPEVLNELQAAWQALNNDSDGIEGIFHRLFSIGSGGLSLLGYSSLLLWLSPWVLLFLVVSVWVLYVFDMKAKKQEYDQKEKKAALDRRYEYLYQTMSDFSYGKDIRLFSLQTWLGHRFETLSHQKVELYCHIRRPYLRTSLVEVLLTLGRELLVYGYLVWQVVIGALSISHFTVYVTTVINFSMSLKKLVQDVAFIQQQNLYVNDYRAYLNKKEVATMKTEEIQKSETYTIQFQNVSFKYPRSERYILKNLNLTIEAGKRLAIVGINGAGKTTLIKLLTRLYEPTEGQILLNGQNIANFDLKAYHELFSVVFQDIKVLGFSIAENVAASSTTHDLRVEQALQQAGLLEKIKDLPKGIETPLLKVLEDDGIELSGGQTQKLALARALYKNAPIMILDEPTSALDALAEYELYQRFDEVIGDKTAIYVSHRLASTRFCDMIAYFEKGKIIEYGTHDELLAKSGEYANMFNIQSQYYQDKEVA